VHDFNLTEQNTKYRYADTARKCPPLPNSEAIGLMMKSSTLRLFSSLVIFLMSSMAYATPPENFTVSSVSDDSKFTLSDYRGKTVVLHFLLKTECPYCLKYTHDYAKLAETTPDIIHIFLKPDSVKETREWLSHLDKKDLEELPQIYRDADAKLAKQYLIPDGYEFHGQKVHYPALVALNGEGKEILRYVGKSNRDRLPAKDFTAKLQRAVATP
jgi:peroxiredoxin Q/BCP